MKCIKLITIAAMCSTLSSCAILTSVLRLPGSILTTAGRTVGLPISNEVTPQTEEQKQEQEEQKIY